MSTEHIPGQYQLKKSENFDNLLQELGLNAIKRKLISVPKPKVTVSISEDKEVTIVTAVPLKTSTIKFKPGEEFDDIRHDDVKVKAMVTLEDNKLTEVQKGEKEEDKEVTIVREFTEEGMTVVTTCNNVVCTRFFKRI